MQPVQDVSLDTTATTGTIRKWFIDPILPALLLAPAIAGVFWLDELGALMLATAALLVGAILRPAHLWIVWLETVVICWLAGGAYTLWGESSGNGDETVLTFMAEAFAFMALLVLLPMFVGRLFGNLVLGARGRTHS